jgi:Na+-driven multidrug efflux pump
MEKNANHYLAEEKVGKLLVKFSVPCILSLLVASLYNMVDQVFIGRGVGYLGNGATNVVFPITVIALALALMVGDGCAAYLSLCQGRGNKEDAHHSVGNSLVVLLIISVVLTALFALCREQILWGFGATENNIEYAREYFRYILVGIPFYIYSTALGSIIRADGSPQFAMVSTLVGCIINLILDPIAIFVLHWGMMGAAVATVAGQVVSALLCLYYLFHTKSFRLKKESFHLQGHVIRSVLPLGVSSFLTQISIVLIMAALNNVLVHYGALSRFGEDIPMTVVGIVMKVFQLVVAFVVGIAAGAQPIIGYNYGAGNLHRVKEICGKILLAEIVVGLVALLSFQLFPLPIISIFGSGDALYNEFAVLAFRIFLGGILFSCVHKSACIVLQALGKPIMSTILSLLRDFVLAIPLALVLPIHYGVVGALYSGLIADVVVFVITLVIIGYVFRHSLNEKTLTA